MTCGLTDCETVVPDVFDKKLAIRSVLPNSLQWNKQITSGNLPKQPLILNETPQPYRQADMHVSFLQLLAMLSAHPSAYV